MNGWVPRLIVAVLTLAGLTACETAHPDQGSGAAAAPAQAGGLSGPQEGSPGNAHNLGTDSSTTNTK